MEELKNAPQEDVESIQKKNCIFCHIVQGKVPSRKVYEDDRVLALLDINPASQGHLLLIPKEHYVILPQLPGDLVSHMFIVAKKLSLGLLRAVEAKGTNIFIANGAVAGQKAPHFMIHIIPRSEGDGLSFLMPKANVSQEQSRDFATRLCAVMRGELPKPVEPEDEQASDLNYDALKEALGK
jgi:histidine triad (HIT) family protein